MGMRGLLFALSLVLVGCGESQSDPEQELRLWVDSAEAAAEDRDRSALMALISPGYTDGRGNDFDSINRMVMGYMLRQKSISLLIKIDDIEVSAESAADMALTVGMAGTSNRSFGLDADAYRFELELVRETDGWQVVAARWGALASELR